MYQALYRKWRPQCFSDVVGQQAVTDTLKAQIESGRLSHAYLFAGSRGTGKTTCAKILSKAVNCLNPVGGDPCNKCEACRGIADGSILDVVEIDAASNNGVEGVRELRDEAIYSPAAARKRVYIIDEVHMFSNSAFNALLKILEEPPEHVLFILATTELHKVPATILSRCQRFTFKRITADDISERICFVAENENIKITRDAADFIARIADGGMRDALSVFDQCASYSQGDISVETVEDAVGLAGSAALISMLRAIAKRDVAGALAQLSQAYNNGRDLISVLNELSACMRDILVLKTAPNAKVSRLAASYDEKAFAELVNEFEAKQLIFGVDTISRTMATISYSANRRIDAELCIIKLCETAIEKDLYALAERIARLEKNPRAVSSAAPAVEHESAPVSAPKAEPVKPQPIAEPKPEAVQAKEELPWEPEPEAKTPETPKVTEEPVPAPQPDGDSSEFWDKILEVAKTKLAPGIIPLLRSITAELRENSLYLTVENPLISDMLKERQYIEPLRECAAQVLGFNAIIRTQKPQEKKLENKAFEELCNNIKDLPNVTII